MKVLYLSSLLISVLGMAVAIAMINVKSALDAWWKLASVFSGGMLGIFLLAAFSSKTKSGGALAGTLAGIMVILWLTLTPMIYPEGALATRLHGYLTIVLSTATIFFIGLISTVLFSPNNKNES